MARSKEMSDVMGFCLEHVESAPLKRRVSLYRSLAEFFGDEKMERAFLQLADELEAADRRCREFHFQFTQSKEAA